MPTGRGLGKVKRHLASIYRDFFRRDTLELYINGEKLYYKTITITMLGKYQKLKGR